MLIIIGILSIILIATLYFEYKYMRPRRRAEIESVLTRDDAYNALMSAKAVSKSLKDMGKDTLEAELLISRAQLNYDQRDYLKTISVAKASKELLVNAKDIPIPEKEPVKSIPSQEEEVVQEEKTVHEVKKLPQNFIESKFLLATTPSEIEKAEKQEKNVDEARRLLAEAQVSFDSADYTSCVKTCMKARRSMSGTSTERPRARETLVADVSKSQVESKPLQTSTETKGSPERCTKCGETLVADDNFCGRCGAGVERVVKCSQCGSVLAKDDVFCRKCGLKLA